MESQIKKSKSTMMILPGKLSGAIIAMPSKSLSHRALILASLTHGRCMIDNIGRSRDIDCTAQSLTRLGITRIDFHGNRAAVEPAQNGKLELFAGESASTLRFLIPLTLLYGGADFLCSGRLPERPLSTYKEALDAEFLWIGSKLHVRGKLKAGTYVLDGEISSQFVSGLLVALPMLEADSVIKIKGFLWSRPYIGLTIDTMRKFGVLTEVRDETYFIPGKQRYVPTGFRVEGDWSHAAFYFGSNAMGSTVTVYGLDHDSLQGDRAILKALNETEVDIADTPDLFPILAASACARKRRTRFVRTDRLRFKESDRISAMEQELNKLGADVYAGHDEFIVNGSGRLKGGTAHSHGDHRVAMALAMASAISEEPIILQGCDAVDKSAPFFFDEFTSLGGRAYEQLGE